MELSKIVFLINDEVSAIRCNYEDSTGVKDYIFKTMIPDLEVDDLVVVQTNTRHGYTVVKVTEIDVEPDLESSMQLKWAVAKLDMDSINKLFSLEKEAVEKVQAAERRRKKAELRQTMFGGEEDMINQLKLASPSKPDNKS